MALSDKCITLLARRLAQATQIYGSAQDGFGTYPGNILYFLTVCALGLYAFLVYGTTRRIRKTYLENVGTGLLDRRTEQSKTSPPKGKRATECS
ncbi:hypothetical protein DL771_004319 [Monosporascus sp. 5C6A]|nr:hypothetical protein DL771_004319 [Monosporascus sp. 5C6A]